MGLSKQLEPDGFVAWNPGFELCVLKIGCMACCGIIVMTITRL